MKSMATLLSLCATVFLAGNEAAAHCQVPCGIYDDHARLHAMYEDITTIDKASKAIQSLAKSRSAQDQNQLTRWVTTKEQHAERIIRTVADYFLTQKIKVPSKAGDKAYLNKLAKHHAVMVAAMKCKQSVAPDAVAALRAAVDGIAPIWHENKKK